jgi:hypothetical protein
MRAIILLLAVLLSATPIHAETRYSLLDDVLFRRIDCKETSTIEVLCYLRMKATGDLRPHWYEGKMPVEIRFAAAKTFHPMTINLENVTLRQALNAVCTQAKLKYRVLDDRLVFEDADGPPPGLSPEASPAPK